MPERPHILLVEDDAAIVQGLRYALEQDGFAITALGTAAQARAALTAQGGAGFDLLLLDIGLPDGSGLDLCRAARQKSNVPVIFLTACDDEANTVLGLDLGADDYIAKPFRLRELQSRIRAVLRRRGAAGGAVTLPGGIRVDTRRAEVTKNGAPVYLSALEYRLLLAFLAHPGQVLSRGQLLGAIWDAGGDYVNDNTLTVYVKRLRAKLEDDKNNAQPLITTVRGLGYRLEV